MNLLEKAEKSLDYLKNNEGTAKSHELQAAVGTLGRCLGALGTRPNCARHYANLLSAAVPNLLGLASHESAEVRLAGDEALNRVVVGGFAFNSYKTNAILLNQIDVNKNARWNRAAISRICLGDCWLRPGVGKIRSQAQTLFPKMCQVVQNTTEVQLVVEAYESNLPRLLDALADYTTDEELYDVMQSLLSLLPRAESAEAAVRRAVGACVAQLCAHRDALLAHVLDQAFEKLWPMTSEDNTTIGWFCVIKAVFEINDMSKFTENGLFTVQDYLDVFQLCVSYAERCSSHNAQNAVLECLGEVLGRATGAHRRALLDPRPAPRALDARARPGRSPPTHGRVGGGAGPGPQPPGPPEPREPELAFSGALRLGSALRLDTPTSSLDDFNIHTPDSEEGERSEAEPALEPERPTEPPREDSDEDDLDAADREDGPQGAGAGVQVEGAGAEARLLPCVRVLAARFLLAGAPGRLLPDRRVRVSVKAGALRCLRAALRLAPRPAARYLQPAADAALLDCSGSSEGTDFNRDDVDEFILERNVCYQDSITESISQDLLRSSDSILDSKREAKSLQKSVDSELKSSKDAPSNILDSKLAASGFSADTNLTSSVFTSASATEYPMSSSGGPPSSSLDLDMRFDHFADVPPAPPAPPAQPAQPVPPAAPRAAPRQRAARAARAKGGEGAEGGESGEAEQQHMSDVFLLAGHADPVLRGLARVCAAAYLAGALEAARGDYARWRGYVCLPPDVAAALSIERLMDLILKGLSDEVHSAVNLTLSALGTLALALSRSVHWALLEDMFNALVAVETNSYWLCRLNLVKLYETLPYQRLFALSVRLGRRGEAVRAALGRLLADRDQRVRAAAARAYASIAPIVYISPRATPASMLAETARQASRPFRSPRGRLALERVREMYFYNDLPAQLRVASGPGPPAGLTVVVGDIMDRLMSSNCKYYTHGLLASLLALCRRWPPWRYAAAYRGHGALALSLARLAAGGAGAGGAGTVAERALLADLCRLLYPATIHDIMRHKSNRDMFDAREVKEKWQHLDNEKVGSLCEEFLQATLKMLNAAAHCVEDAPPAAPAQRPGLALPGSPVRRRSHDSTPRKSSMSSESAEEKGSVKRKPHGAASSLKANFVGNFQSEPAHVKHYDSLRAAYSNHKINLDPKGSIFYEFLSTVLDALAIQLEFSTEVEFGPLTEEILYYLKVTMPVCPEKSVYCVTQLLKCLFGTNMINQYSDYMSIADEETKYEKARFFEDVMLINDFNTELEPELESGPESRGRRGGGAAGAGAGERRLLAAMDSFNRNRMDRKWGTNKTELERYIRLFEPAVIQALKTYTLQHDVPLQRAVLQLLGQLLALRVNYCMLDSEQLFVGFLMKQLELLEQHEIPNCCELVKSILLFLVQLSSSKHHTKQIIEIPKLIQLCDGLLAAGAPGACVAGLEPVALWVFADLAAVGASALGPAQQQEIQATREVIFYMLQKTMHLPQVLEVAACVVALARQQRGGGRWAALAADTLLPLLAERSAECGGRRALAALELLLDGLGRDALLEQPRVELLLKILFKAPPDQATSPRKLKLRYLIIILVLLRKVLVLIPESEILLSIDYLKATCIAPQSIFFNVKPDTDPLNVQNVNETCANLAPDVILVRFLFRTLTYAILELDDVAAGEGGAGGGEGEEGAEDEEGEASAGAAQDELLYSVCVGLVVHVKHMLHLTDGCAFPRTARSAQSLLQQEQSGTNTGLYSPDENVPLDALNARCLRAPPALTLHWSHLLVRARFLAHGYWRRLTGYARELPLAEAAPLRVDALQLGVALAYCEHFAESGLGEVGHLTWLLASRGRLLLAHAGAPPVQRLLAAVQRLPGASALLLQAVAARCQACLQGEFALNTLKVLSSCHESQSGALVFFICRIIGKLEPSLAGRFASLATERCRSLRGVEGAGGAESGEGGEQLGKEDVQVALELLQRAGAHRRYPELVAELGALAASATAPAPAPAPDRAVNPRAVLSVEIDHQWLLLQAKTRCCRQEYTVPNVPRYRYLAQLLAKLPLEDLTTIVSCPEFDRRIIGACFKMSCDTFIRDFLDVLSAYEAREAELDAARRPRAAGAGAGQGEGVDSNSGGGGNVHVFKKSDNKESKSQFFIPMTSIDNEIQENLDNLKITDEECEISVPDLPQLYVASVSALDKMLADILRLLPKRSRPPSQVEGGAPDEGLAGDRHTRRCHRVFQDKAFYREFMTIHAVLADFLPAVDRVIAVIDDAHCDLLDKCVENILPSSLQRNLAFFSVVSLQYLSFLVNNKEVEVPVTAEVSFRAEPAAGAGRGVRHALGRAAHNAAAALALTEVWAALDAEDGGRAQSAVSCLYAIVEYSVKDTKPLVLKSYIRKEDYGPKPDLIVTGDKLITLIEYWEQNFCIKKDSNILGARLEKSLRKLLVSLARLGAVRGAALVPPRAWPRAAARVEGGRLRADLPLPALQDSDLLEAFLFRVNLVGWTSKKQFEEVWVALLGALQGDGPHWAVRGAAQLLAGAAPAVRGRASPHVPRAYLPLSHGMQRLRSILVGSPAFRVFEDVNLERVPLLQDDIGGPHYAQFSTDYLRLAAELISPGEAAGRVRREVRRRRRRPVDLDSCVQLLMDVAADMLDPKAPTGLAARAALLGAVSTASVACGTAGVWRRAAALLAALPAAHWPHAAAAALHALAACLPVLPAPPAPDALQLAAVHERLLRSLGSGYAPLRQAALRGWLLQLAPASGPALTALRRTLTQQLADPSKISVYEQSLCWATLLELAPTQPELVALAVDFLTAHPHHYCADLLVRGIISILRRQVLPKDLKKSIVEKLLDNMNDYSEEQAVQIMLVHLFSADDRLVSARRGGDVADMEPDVLLGAMERITLLYRTLRCAAPSSSRRCAAAALRYLLREALPPAATLSRAVIELLDSCRAGEAAAAGALGDRLARAEAAALHCDLVFEVFEASIRHGQLAVLRGWLCEALQQLLGGRVSRRLLPRALLALLAAAAPAPLRLLQPLALPALHAALLAGGAGGTGGDGAYPERRLLCLLATRSGFTEQQVARLRELCEEHEQLDELRRCLLELTEPGGTRG